MDFRIEMESCEVNFFVKQGKDEGFCEETKRLELFLMRFLFVLARFIFGKDRFSCSKDAYANYVS